ncbi:hypothetical protein PFICI_06489 [Pestalotiopsis fici W106-1]|uniref:Uncharacterized protein n=1 Tax=Pestalotiopsis fici (strain W106-1 / CGMCC3.15140) TaxID=1229662 RepID=W3X7W3_PESFW|nr:uncharacterized protein PFICI_06489 [Pestalotiopsis fici W106-1]ETS81487.1 hypothetical protein PFICI_06489 [Pestalotiopsis fici W106-1]
MTRGQLNTTEEAEIPDVFPNIFSMTVRQLENVAAPLGIVTQKIGNSPYKAELIARIFMHWAELEPGTQTRYLGTVIMLCKGTQKEMLDYANDNEVPEHPHPQLKEHKSGTMQRILEHIRLVEEDAESTLSRTSRGTRSRGGLRRIRRHNKRNSTASLSQDSRFSTDRDANQAKVLEALGAFVQSLAVLLPSADRRNRHRRGRGRPETPVSEISTSSSLILVRELENELDEWEGDIYGVQRRQVTEADRFDRIREIFQELLRDDTA